MFGKITYLLAIYAVLALACVRPLDVGFDVVTPKLAVVCNFTDNQALEVVVSSTRSILSSDEVHFVTDARVDVFEDGTFIEELAFIPASEASSPPRFRSQILIPKTGALYMIQVHAPGFESVTAFSSIPPSVSIDTNTVQFSMIIEEDDMLHNRADFEVSIRMSDPPGQTNYYHLNFYQEAYDYRINVYGDTIREQFFSLPLQIEPLNWNIPMVQYFDNRGVLLKDDSFSGQSVTLLFKGSFRYRKHDQVLGNFIIELRSVSREYYLYHSALVRQQQAGSGLFSEPVILFNNIENGLGVFAGFSSQFFFVPPGN